MKNYDTNILTFTHGDKNQIYSWWNNLLGMGLLLFVQIFFFICMKTRSPNNQNTFFSQALL